MKCKTFLSSVCAYLNSQIYCYGGNTTPNNQPHIDMMLYTLNPNKAQRLDQLDWEPVKVKNDFVPEERPQPQFAVLSDGNQLLLEGGGSTNDTIIYDARENTWQSIPNNLQIISTNSG